MNVQTLKGRYHKASVRPRSLQELTLSRRVGQTGIPTQVRYTPKHEISYHRSQEPVEVPQHMLPPATKGPKPEDSTNPRPCPVWPPRPKENPNPFATKKRPTIPRKPFKPFDGQQKRGFRSERVGNPDPFAIKEPAMTPKKAVQPFGEQQKRQLVLEAIMVPV